MNSALDKKIRRSIDVLEGNSAQRPGISAKRNRDPLAEACNEVRRILADEEYWPKAYTNRALHGLFDVLDKDDANLRILADQCLNAILRKFLIKGHSSRTLAVLLNEIGRKASARGFVAALTMLEATLHYAKEARVSVYAMHLFNSMKETIKRPEQAIQSSIEQLFPQICSFFKLDLTDQHYRYVDALCLQCFENLQLPGVANRAAVALLAAFYENFPQIRTKIAHNLLDTLRIAEEVNDKNKIVGSFNFFKKAWNFVKDENVIHAVLYRCLCALKSSMSEIQVAVLELLDVVCSSDSLNLLEFKPSLFIDQSYQSSSDLESLNNVSITEKDFVLDGEESTNISRFNSVNSLEESLPPTARSEVSEDNDVFNKDSDDEDTASGRTSKSGNDQVESDPLFRPNSPSEYLLDNVEEQQESPTDSSYQLIDGPLCEKLPKVPDQQQASKQPFQQQHFVYYTCYTILSKFLLSGKPGELKSDTDVRISIKVMVLKVMANIVGKYEGVLIKNDTESTWNITDVVLGGQSFMDIQSLIQSSDDTLAVRCFEVFANLEARLVRSGVKYKQTAMPSKFSIHLVQLLRQPNPMKLKELFQILTKTQIILQDQNTLKTVLNSAIDTFDCDYFLLKIARAEFLSKIRWDLVNPMIKEQYQKKCLLLLIKNLFDSDYRVSQAVAEVFSSAVKNAELSKLSNIFNVSCPEDITGFSLSQQPQIYALHPNYSFRGDCPDLLYEHNLTVAITMLYDEFCTSKNAAGFIIGLLSLTDAFSPNIYGNAWALELSCHNFQKSVIDVLVELADSTISQPSLMVSTLRLIGQISNGIAENLMTKQKCQIQQEKNCIEDVIVLHTRVVNMYFTVIRESSAKSTVNMSSPMFTKRNWVQGGGRDSASENRSYSISHLVGTGVHPTRPTSYTSSLSLRRIEPLIRGAFTNFQTSLKKNSEERCILLLNTALDGLSALLEVVPRDVLNLFLDEFFVYIKTIMHVSLASCTALISQLLKVIFDGNAYHIDINTLVSLRLKNSVVPNDQLDMYIGRSINAFSVYLAFLDRSEHFTTHQLRHFGWLNKNKSSVATTRSSSHALEIGTRLEQFERFVTFLMHAFMNNSQKEVRGNILTLLGVLVMNDVRYDKLDPQSRIWKSVLQIVRHPNLKYANEFESLFKFICLVTRVIDVSFDELIALLTKCIEHSNEENCHHLMDGLHIVVLEAVGYYAKL
ncbi:unnamed protein product [Bursaphelenchus okinawaensis]|uniref:Uncharacterized protein n=1 Tax=Bursaphelenchus okinawaensis TaxID=465554 RepID=A0A811KNP8_9BILA|nr:unnamed protein product [Bursaphelenchus okinawaensis]CAG9107511.1 unnamed protein product [Bursaphelenchus okinawaensis]